MKYIYILLCLFLFGFSYDSKLISTIEPLTSLPPPPPPPNIAPPSLPPNFVPNFQEFVEVQINSLPHPFNVNGNIPYAVWVNGERLPLNSIELKALAKSLNLKFEQPTSTAQINSGAGWLFPLSSNNKTSRSHNFIKQ